MILIALPFVVALLLSLLWGDRVIALLAAAKARQPVSDDAPDAHKIKHGTPTMGGLLIVTATVAALVVQVLYALVKVWASLGTAISDAFQILMPGLLPLMVIVGIFLLGCGIGFLDDLGKARKKLNQAGLSERAKLSFQIVVSLLFVGYLYLRHTDSTTVLQFGGLWFDLGLVYYALAVLYLCYFGNAVNFTDGLDGLSSGVTLIVSLALGGIALLTRDTTASLAVPFYGAIAGACAGFLWFNAHPARVFMGDTGSLALGMGLAAAALIAKQEFLLLIIGAVYGAEMFSTIIQRYVFIYRRKRYGIEYAKANRVFRRAPLHHHFEELGWPETRVVARFYIATLLFAALGVLIAPYFHVGGGR